MDPAGTVPFGRSRYRSVRLFRGFGHHIDRDEFAVEFALVESHNTIGKREKGVVLAHADIGTGIELGTALAHEDVAGDDVLAAELLHTKATTG